MDIEYKCKKCKDTGIVTVTKPNWSMWLVASPYIYQDEKCECKRQENKKEDTHEGRVKTY